MFSSRVAAGREALAAGQRHTTCLDYQCIPMLELEGDLNT